MYRFNHLHFIEIPFVYVAFTVGAHNHESILAFCFPFLIFRGNKKDITLFYFFRDFQKIFIFFDDSN